MGVANVLVVTRVEVAPPDASVVLGGNVQLVATPKTASGISVPGRSVSWASSAAGTVSVTPAGVAQALALGGPVTITATVDGVEGAASITVNPVPIASISLSVTSRSLVVGESFQLTATAKDANGAVLPGRVFTWQSSQPSIAAVTSTGVVLGMSVGGPVNITASAEGQSAAAAITVGARPAVRLAFLQQPGTTAASQPITPALLVAVQDDQGGTVTTGSRTVTLSLGSNPGGATLGGTLSAPAVNGVATFNNISLNLAGNGYTLVAASTGLTSATSNPFNITAGNANQLFFTTAPPGSAGSGVPLSPQPVVQIRDASGNPVPQAGVLVTASVASGIATLTGATATTSGTGAASFSGLTVSGPAGSVTLAFSAPSLISVTSGPLTLGAGAPASLAISTQPSATAQSGAPFAVQPKVILRDAAGNRVAQAGVAITASINSGPAGASLGGSTVVTTDATGEAVYGNLSLTGSAGSYTLRFTGGGLTGVNSNAIALSAGAGQSLAVTVQPSGSAASGAVFAQQPAVQLRDAGGNPVAQAGVLVTASIQSGGGTLGGTATVATSAAGTATFTNLSIAGTVGSRTLLFAAAGYVSVASAPVNITPGPATQLTITTQPSPTAVSGQPLAQQPVLQVRDAQGNAVASAGIQVSAVIASGGGSLGGTTTIATDASGVATYSNLAITGTTGSRTLSFSTPGITAVVSGPIAVGQPPATKLAIVTQPPATAQSGAAFTTAPVIQLQDASGIAVASAGVAVTVALSGASGTLGGTLTVNTDATGKATFTGLSISGLVGNYTLAFSSSGLTGVTSNAIALSAGAATKLAILTQPPSSAKTGVNFSPQPVIRITDAAGNTVSTSGITVTATLVNPGLATLGGDRTKDTSSGVATYSDLRISGTGTFTIRFTATGLSEIISNSITVTL